MTGSARRAAIALREVTAKTLREVCNLTVSPEQRQFVAPNAISIAQAYFEPAAWFRAVYADDTPVGFAMLYDPTRMSPKGAGEIDEGEHVLELTFAPPPA
jgi:diamine N-acetyltransferase